MGNTFKEMSGSFCFEANLDDAGPSAAFHKTRHAARDDFLLDAINIFDKFRKGMADNLGEWNTEKVGEAAIGGTNFTLETESQEKIVERINEVAKTLSGISKSSRKAARVGGR